MAEPLPLANRALYASGSVGSTALIQALTAWVFYFYTSEEATDGDRFTSVFLVGAAMTVGRAIDAITDPIIGYWSDVTRSRWGRRVPFVVLGAPLMAVTFILIWIPPVEGTHWVNALWLGILVQVYFLMVTIVGAPYSGIYPELAVTKEERLSVSAWELIFALLGGAVALIATGPLIEAYGFVTMGVLIAIIGTIPRYIGLLAVRGRLQYQPERSMPFAEFRRSLVRAFRLTVSNVNFLALVSSLALYQAGLLMLTQVIPFFVVEILGRTERAQAYVTGAAFVGALLAVPVVMRLARRRDKRAVYGVSLVAATSTLPFLYFVGLLPAIPELAQILVIVGIVGLPLSGLFILPDAMLADVVEEDLARTGSRREAMYYSSRATIEKLAQMVATGLFALILGIFGATAEEQLGIRLIGPAAAACTALAWVVFRFGYNIREEEGAPLSPRAALDRPQGRQ